VPTLNFQLLTAIKLKQIKYEGNQINFSVASRFAFHIQNASGKIAQNQLTGCMLRHLL
jgi:hypothetical protein